MKNIRFLVSILCVILCEIVDAQQENAYPLERALWHSSQISVCWDNPTPENKEYRDTVQQAIKDTWERYSALHFTDWCPAIQKDGDIHIFINDEGPHTQDLGTKIQHIKHGMVLNFTFQTWSQSCLHSKIFCIKAIAIHEFGHALGFAHEQNRKDCKFSDCEDKEQGPDGSYEGDWYFPCDISSVMNYCNPQWSNNGKLSHLDIAAVQKLYGRPPGMPSMESEYQGLQIAYTSNQLKETTPGSREISHEFKVYTSGSQQELDSISKVIYHLHPTFSDPVRTITNRSTNFGIGLKVWGEFKILADVYFKNGSIKTFKKYLSFTDNGEHNPKMDY